MAKANPFRFSTKYTDTESGLVNYGGNIYNASTGRWLKRDLAGEDACLNLYATCGNDFENQVDPFGNVSFSDFKPYRPPSAAEWRTLISIRENIAAQSWGYATSVQRFLASHKLEDRRVSLSDIMDLVPTFRLDTHRDKCKLKKALGKIKEVMIKMKSARGFESFTVGYDDINPICRSCDGFKVAGGSTIAICEHAFRQQGVQLQELVAHELSHLLAGTEDHVFKMYTFGLNEDDLLNDAYSYGIVLR